MILYKLFTCLFGIANYLLPGTLGREVILGGIKSETHQFPYQVSVQTDIHGHNCGGGIISEQHILTAAHCVIDDSVQSDTYQFLVLIGTDNLKKISETAFVVQVAQIFVPEGFLSPPKKTIDDIAVVKLHRRLDFQKHPYLKPLELPKKHENDYNGKTAIIAGFGWDWVKIQYNKEEEKGGNSDGHLRYSEAHVITTADCMKEYHREKIPWLRIHENKLCARVIQHEGARRGVCGGDSGSPLVLDGHTVIGVLSLSPFGCSERKIAAVYTRVTSYLEFIDKAINDKCDSCIQLNTMPAPVCSCI